LCGLCARLIKYNGEVKAWQTDLTFNLTYGNTFIQLTYTYDNQEQFPPMVSIGIDYDTVETAYS
jgi:hypothetical protein